MKLDELTLGELRDGLDAGRFGAEELARHYLERIAADRLNAFIDVQPQRHLLRVRHRRDTGGVDRLELLDQAENVVDLRVHVTRLVGVEFEPREVRDALDLG